MNKPILRTLSALVMILLSSSVSAQIAGILGRFEAGYGISTIYATYNGGIQNYDTASQTYKNSNTTRKVRSHAGVSRSVGEYIPLTRLGRKSELALSISALFNVYLFENLSLYQHGDSIFSNPLYSFTGVAVQTGFPIGIDFKFGCDAFCVKNNRWCATLGAGVYPNFNATVFQDDIGAGFGLNPYVKAEGGIRWGFVWKLRAMVMFTNTDLISKSNSLSAHLGDPSKFTLTQNANLTVSLIVMPFAPFWKKTGFWDQNYRK